MLADKFQFHKGTIKTQEGSGRWSDFSYFNSIKVRLKPMSAADRARFSAFQFHKGTIKTRLKLFKSKYHIISIP